MVHIGEMIPLGFINHIMLILCFKLVRYTL